MTSQGRSKIPISPDRFTLCYLMPTLDHWSTYFLANHSQPCSNQAGFPVIGPSVTRLSNMADIVAQELSSAVKCVLERFHVEKFRETQLEAIINLLQG